MHDLRRARRCLAVAIMVEYIKENKTEWLRAYEEKYGERTIANVTRLCARFAKRHGFVRKTATTAIMSAEDLAAKKSQFASQFWVKYGAKAPHIILDYDEAGIFYDMPPRKILTLKKADAIVDTIEKNSGRVTAVLTIRGDVTSIFGLLYILAELFLGFKLPILFIKKNILKAKSGGVIESQETALYPPGHHYIVQKNAWMNTRGWRMYLHGVLK